MEGRVEVFRGLWWRGGCRRRGECGGEGEGLSVEVGRAMRDD